MLVKESLLRKSDELSGAVRDFFERLKTEVQEQEASFYAKTLRTSMRLHPMKLSRYLRELESRGYVQRIGGQQEAGL